MFSLRYELTGRGWARCLINSEAGSCALTASYLGDALGGLLHAIAALAEGAHETRAAFREEPGEYRWIFRRMKESYPHLVEISVLQFDGRRTDPPDDKGQQVFCASIPVIDLCISARAMARAVLDEHGEQGYLDRWVNHPFPQASLDRLDRFLKDGSST